MKDTREIRTIRPLVNIQERENDILLEAEMPGISKDSIEVEVNGDELSISAARLSVVPDGYSVIRNECQPVRYERVFTLGSDIDKSDINANYENGILLLTLKKSERAKPKKITINEPKKVT